MKRFLLLVVVWSVAFHVYPQNEEMRKAILRNDAVAVVELGNMNAENEVMALDALATQFDIYAYSYEELSGLLSKAERQSLREYIAPIVIEHEKQIREHILHLTPEELPKYIATHPMRSDFVCLHVSNIIRGSIDSMQYRELLYLDNIQFQYCQDTIKSSLETRVNERKDIYRENAGAFVNNEQSTVDGLKYLLEKAAWEYFVQAHTQLTSAYAQIPMVNDDSYIAASQYQSMVKACFSPKLVAEILQKIVDDYCTQVNKSRKEYAAMAGKTTYKSLRYKVPIISLNTNVNYRCLDNIAVSRQNYSDNLDTSSTVSGVTTWLLGPIYGLLARGIGDYLTIETLAESEYNARKEYVDNVHDAVRNDFQTYIVKLISDLDRSYKNNSLEYEKDIAK